jgi:hypothetical protein
MWFINANKGGSGHLIRALAIGRRAPEPVTIYSLYPRYTDVNCTVVQDLKIATKAAEQASLVITDTFPSDLGYTVEKPQVYIQRGLTQEFADTLTLPPYDLNIIPGRFEPAKFPGIVTAGWTIRDIPEITEERSPTPLIYVVMGEDASYKFDTKILTALQDLGEVSYITQRFSGGIYQKYFPAMEILNRAWVVICAATNNSIAESLALDIPTVAVPFGVKTDPHIDRAIKAASMGRVMLAYDKEQILAATEIQLSASSERVPLWTNGANEAVDLIRSLGPR